MSNKPFTPFSPHEDNEWYTPPEIVEFARYVLDGIALDPASCREANYTVGAERIYTWADDGLQESWDTLSFGPGGVFCNPPYSVTGAWWSKMLAEFRAGHFNAGLFLANNKTETAWFQEALETCPVLFVRSRLSFWKPGRASKTGYFGSALVLLSRPFTDPPSHGPSIGGDTLSTSLYSDPEDGPLARFLERGSSLGRVVISV